jgi:hypothetical protein
LDIVFDPFLVVVGHRIVFLEKIEVVAADVADRDFGFIAQAFGLLGDVLADIFGERRHDDDGSRPLRPEG